MLRNVNGSYRLRSILEVLNLSFCLNEKKILLQKSCYIATPWPGVHTYIFRRGKASHRTRTHWGVWNQRISWDCCSLLPVWPGRSRAGPKLVQNESHLQSQIAELSGTWGVAYTMVIRLWFHIRWPGRGCISFQSWNSLNCQCITRQFLYSMLDCEIIWKWVIATQTISWVWILLYIIILFWIWILFWRRTQVSYEEDGVKLTPTIPCSFWTNLGSFGHSWINHFS
jgi:hypothetical protein